ncbi:MAG: hypothetical protein P1V97_14860 [Planctomycetota bacterium]|nr:hypothetical protein [Planctomycetota bacterium]
MDARSRSRLAILLTVASLIFVVWLDFRLLIRNPEELKRQTERLLQKTLGKFNPQFSEIEVDLPNFARLKGFVLHKATKPEEVLLRATDVEARFGWFGIESIVIRDALVVTEFSSDIDFEGKRPKAPRNPLWDIDVSEVPAQLKIVFENARFNLYDVHMKKHHHMRLERLEAQVSDGLAIVANGSAQLLLEVNESQPEYAKAQSDESLASGSRLLPVVEGISFELNRLRDGEFRALINVDKFHCRQALGGALPKWPKEKVWDELGPGGVIAAKVTVAVKGEKVDYVVKMEARNTSCCLKGFPYPITNITGQFSIANEIVSWENARGSTSGQGRILGRGSVFIGGEKEKVTIYSFTRFWNVPIDKNIDKAVAAADKGAQDAFAMFKPRGKVTGVITVAKDPDGGPPQVSATIDELGGTMNAQFSGMPIPAKNFRGRFKLLEGGGVRIDNARFDIAGGGKAICQARMFKNDLIFLDIRATNVPVSSELLGHLPPAVSAYVSPLGPLGGRIDAKVLIRKNHPKEKVIPEVDLTLRSVGINPKDFPIPVKVSGNAKIRLSYPPGTQDGAKVKPTINLAINVSGESQDKGLIAGLKSRGKIIIDPAPTTGAAAKIGLDLTVNADSITVSPALISKLPTSVKPSLDLFSPKGTLTDVSVSLKGFDDISVKAKGQDFKVKYEKFPVEVEPKVIDVTLRQRTITIHEVFGRVPSGGEYQLKGALILPPEGMSDRPSDWRDPIVDLTIKGEQIKIVPQLIAALPEELAATANKLRATGYLGTTIHVQMAPGLNPRGEPLITGVVQLEGVRAEVMRLIPEKDRFSDKAVDKLFGRLILSEDEVSIESLRGQLFGSTVKATGRIARVPQQNSGDPDFSFVVQLPGFKLFPKLITDMPFQVRPLFKEYQPSGIVDIEINLLASKQKDGDLKVENSIEIEPQNMSARPKLVEGRLVSGIRGLISISPIGLTVIDIDGKYEGTPFRLRRSLKDEDQSLGGQRYTANIENFDFKKRAVAGLPEDLRALVGQLNPSGQLDSTFMIQLGKEKKDPAHYLAELFLKDLTVDMGVKLTGVKGTTQLSGILGPKGRLGGAIQFNEARWLKQPFKEIRGQLEYNGEEFWLRNLSGQIHGGRFSGYAQYNKKKEEYRGRIDLRDLSFAKIVEGLSKIDQKEEKDEKAELRKTPITGRVDGWVDFNGNADQPNGFGEISLRNSNVLPVPLLLRINELLTLEGKKVSSFDRINVRYHFEGKGGFESIVIDRALLQSKKLELECVGRIWIDGPNRGDCDLLILPLDPTDNIQGVNLVTRLLKYQITSIRATGKVSDPTVSWIPLRGFFDVLEKFGQQSAEFLKNQTGEDKDETRKATRAKEEEKKDKESGKKN